MAEIEIRNLTKSFDGHVVLDHVSLCVEKGDVYGVLGLSGAGKSTLVRCINGLETFDEGEIYFEGELLSSPNKKISRHIRPRIAMIFQQFNLLQQRTVQGNVELALEIQGGHSKAQRIAIAKKCLEEVGLLEKANSYPSQLSGGQQQRVAIARALSLNPDVLLSDEATSALDPETTRSILELLAKLNKERGLTIIMISHQMNAIEQICNKVAIIDSAKIVEEGLLSDVFLAPKADIAKKLVYTNHIHTKLSKSKAVRFLFHGNSDEPLLANLVQEAGILVSVVYADTKLIEDKVYGQLVIRMPKQEEDKEKLRKYLSLHHIDYEEVEI